MKNTPEVRFCVCAMIDLLGFSSHLENSAYDVRTTIGQQAIKRLETLEEAVALYNDEASRTPGYYDDRIVLQRINDALILSMDLDDILVPSVGQTTFHDIPIAEIHEHFTEKELETAESFVAAQAERLQTAIDPLRKFLGVIARIHRFVSKREADGYFPGAKTVVCSGFRRPFITRAGQRDDHFSANFAFANVMSAEKQLHGPGLFADNNLLEMLAREEYSKHLLQFSHLFFSGAVFDPFESEKNAADHFASAKMASPVEVDLFRKRYSFRSLHAAPLTYFQALPSLRPYLSGKRKPNLDNLYYRNIVQTIQQGVSREDRRPRLKPCLIYNGSDDMTVPVEQFAEFLEHGRSPAKEATEEVKLIKEHGIDGKIPKPIADLLNQEHEIALEQLDVEGLGLALFFMSEQTFAALRPLLVGNLSLLEYDAGHCQTEPLHGVISGI